MPERLVLHPAPALVELLVGQLGEVERISDLANMAEAFVEDLAVRARHVEHTPTDRPLHGIGMTIHPHQLLARHNTHACSHRPHPRTRTPLGTKRVAPTPAV